MSNNYNKNGESYYKLKVARAENIERWAESIGPHIKFLYVTISTYDIPLSELDKECLTEYGKTIGILHDFQYLNDPISVDAAKRQLANKQALGYFTTTQFEKLYSVLYEYEENWTVYFELCSSQTSLATGFNAYATWLQKKHVKSYDLWQTAKNYGLSTLPSDFLQAVSSGYIFKTASTLETWLELDKVVAMDSGVLCTISNDSYLLATQGISSSTRYKVWYAYKIVNQPIERCTVRQDVISLLHDGVTDVREVAKATGASESTIRGIASIEKISLKTAKKQGKMDRVREMLAHGTTDIQAIVEETGAAEATIRVIASSKKISLKSQNKVSKVPEEYLRTMASAMQELGIEPDKIKAIIDKSKED